MPTEEAKSLARIVSENQRAREEATSLSSQLVSLILDPEESDGEFFDNLDRMATGGNERSGGSREGDGEAETVHSPDGASQDDAGRSVTTFEQGSGI